MEYRRMHTENGEIAYQVFDGANLCAEFACSIKGERFWIDALGLKTGSEDFQTMDRVLQFIQYQSWVAGFSAMYTRLNLKNLFYIEMYRRYGFRQIAQEEKSMANGVTDWECVMEYVLPETREEHFLAYLKRKR